jgi:hypothetical protein
MAEIRFWQKMTFRLLIVRLLNLSLILGLMACGDGVIQRIGQPTPMPQAPMKKGFLIFKVKPTFAKLYLNGKYMGKIDQYPKGAVLVDQQIYHVMLMAENHGNWYGTIDLNQEKQLLDVQMLPIFVPKKKSDSLDLKSEGLSSK